MQWEYLVEAYEHDLQNSSLEKELDEHGEEGWELVSIRRGRMVFKREKVIECTTTNPFNKRTN